MGKYVLYSVKELNIKTWKYIQSEDETNQFVDKLKKITKELNTDLSYFIIPGFEVKDGKTLNTSDNSKKEETKIKKEVIKEPEKTNKKDFYSLSNTSHESVGQSKIGKYSYTEEYGDLDESTNVSNKFEMAFKLSETAQTSSYIFANSNKEAVNNAISLIKTNEKISVYLYNLDDHGQRTNFIYSYEFGHMM